MAKYIELDALVAKIERRVTEGEKVAKEIPSSAIMGLIQAYKNTLSIINTLEVKEVDLKEEVERFAKECGYKSAATIDFQFAKHFFELGMRVNNPITAADRGTAEEIIINLKRVEQDYRINLTKEIEWVRNKVKKGE